MPPIERKDAIATLEAGPWVGSTFGRWLMNVRRSVETTFGNLTGFGGGLCHLPPWVRGLRRVRQYVLAKLLINAARIRRKHE